MDASFCCSFPHKASIRQGNGKRHVQQPKRNTITPGQVHKPHRDQGFVQLFVPRPVALMKTVNVLLRKRRPSTLASSGVARYTPSEIQVPNWSHNDLIFIKLLNQNSTRLNHRLLVKDKTKRQLEVAGKLFRHQTDGPSTWRRKTARAKLVRIVSKRTTGAKESV